MGLLSFGFLSSSDYMLGQGGTEAGGGGYRVGTRSEMLSGP